MKQNEAKFAIALEQYHPLILSMTETFFSRGSEYGLDREEINQEAQIALYNAVCTFNEEQTDVTFGLYAKICMRNRLVSLLRRGKKAARAARAAVPSPPSERELAKVRLEELREDIAGILTSTEQKVLDGYLSGLTYLEIAKRCGYTTKTVDNALWRVKKKIREHFGVPKGRGSV
ncbi:MAG: sigma-70 family RNA polymerase sigma factor [Oscillospiraceae bacterium]|nr:sigma-70 family RNA polymerase sigma factor [Oscillospiraceae bacterium]